MMPTSHEIGIAVVAACRITGADPLDVLTGGERVGGCPIPKMQATSRARAYAARAIDKVFNRPDIVIARPVIARLVGVNKPSLTSYFGSLEARPLPWWSDTAFKSVVETLMAYDAPEETQAAVEEPAPQVEKPADPVQSPAHPVQSKPKPVQKPAPPPLKIGPLPPVPSSPAAPKVKPPIGALERGGFRPAPGTAERVLQDDKADKRIAAAAYVPVGRPAMGKVDDFLRQAVLNTQKMTPPPED